MPKKSTNKVAAAAAARDDKTLPPEVVKDVLRTVVISLVLDLVSFTLILPLFPRLVDFYREVEASNENPTIVTSILSYLNTFKASFSRPISSKFDVVLLGGALGTLYSLLQALAAPVIGWASDKYGRRTVLLWSMVGNVLSVVIWIMASDIYLFLASRIVAGLSEANVQICQAIAADVSPKNQRGRAMAIIGVVFCFAFTLGPILGAYVASKTITLANPFAATALLSLVFLVAETIYLYIKLPETLPQRPSSSSVANSTATSSSLKDVKNANNAKGSFTLVIAIQFFFLLIFSGMESSLTFMTFDLFSYSSKDSGKLLGFIGLIASLFQGSFTRRQPPHVVVKTGLMACMISFLLLARVQNQRDLYIAAFFLGVTSATVVTGLTALASLMFDGTEQGAKLGVLRSAGQMGRGLGPILFCSLYWFTSREIAYTAGGAGMALITAVAWIGLSAPIVSQDKAIKKVDSKQE